MSTTLTSITPLRRTNTFRLRWAVYPSKSSNALSDDDRKLRCPTRTAKDTILHAQAVPPQALIYFLEALQPPKTPKYKAWPDRAPPIPTEQLLQDKETHILYHTALDLISTASGSAITWHRLRRIAHEAGYNVKDDSAEDLDVHRRLLNLNLPSDLVLDLLLENDNRIRYFQKRVHVCTGLDVHWMRSRWNGNSDLTDDDAAAEGRELLCRWTQICHIARGEYDISTGGFVKQTPPVPLHVDRVVVPIIRDSGDVVPITLDVKSIADAQVVQTAPNESGEVSTTCRPIKPFVPVKCSKGGGNRHPRVRNVPHKPNLLGDCRGLDEYGIVEVDFGLGGTRAAVHSNEDISHAQEITESTPIWALPVEARQQLDRIARISEASTREYRKLGTTAAFAAVISREIGILEAYDFRFEELSGNRLPWLENLWGKASKGNALDLMEADAVLHTWANIVESAKLTVEVAEEVAEEVLQPVLRLAEQPKACPFRIPKNLFSGIFQFFSGGKRKREEDGDGDGIVEEPQKLFKNDKGLPVITVAEYLPEISANYFDGVEEVEELPEDQPQDGPYHIYEEEPEAEPQDGPLADLEEFPQEEIQDVPEQDMADVRKYDPQNGPQEIFDEETQDGTLVTPNDVPGAEFEEGTQERLEAETEEDDTALAPEIVQEATTEGFLSAPTFERALIERFKTLEASFSTLGCAETLYAIRISDYNHALAKWENKVSNIKNPAQKFAAVKEKPKEPSFADCADTFDPRRLNAQLNLELEDASKAAERDATLQAIITQLYLVWLEAEVEWKAKYAGPLSPTAKRALEYTRLREPTMDDARLEYGTRMLARMKTTVTTMVV